MRVFDKVDFDEWEESANKCDYATFFHTPAWYKVFLQTRAGSEIVVKKFLWDDGKTAIFPLLLTRAMRGFLKTYQSSPAGCYGGWISSDALGTEQVATMTRWIRRHFKNLVWRLNPFTNGSNEVARLFPTRGDSTQILYLSRYQNEDSLLKNYNYSVRKQVRKGQKAGFKITQASTWDDWKKYFQIYQMALARWGDKATSKYSLKFFQTIFDLHSASVKLWLVLSEDQIVGGNLNFYQGKHCVEWHAALDSNFFKYGVRNFFVHNIILDALKRGYKIYDFNPSGGHEGVKAFKKSFGAQALPSPVVHIESSSSKFIKTFYSKLRVLIGS